MLKSAALQIIATKISGCTLCQEISDYRAQNNYLTAPGEGDPNAKVMVLGEALGSDEAEQGRPFVGKSGRLLMQILKAAGFEREELFITNILKCRPPNNRTPTTQEAANCRKFLDLQIKCVNPEWILCFGKTASIYLLGKPEDTPMGRMRGEHEFAGKKVICSYHPSFALRTPSAKQDIWDDLQPIISALQLKNSS